MSNKRLKLNDIIIGGQISDIHKAKLLVPLSSTQVAAVVHSQISRYLKKAQEK